MQSSRPGEAAHALLLRPAATQLQGSRSQPASWALPASQPGSQQPRRSHPQPPHLRLLLQPALLHKLERGAGAAVHAPQRAGAEAWVKEPVRAEWVGVEGRSVW